MATAVRGTRHFCRSHIKLLTRIARSPSQRPDTTGRFFIGIFFATIVRMSENSKKLSTESYKGVRDFFPAEMAIQEYIFGVWKKTVESFGYEEYGASVLEPADLYKAKSGDEIVNEQTYTFIDRGEREVTLRPEMTPTVARMVAARKRELVFPLRWYSIPNLFRYEAPQRGRVREHWQLNVDMFGVDGIEADVELISVAHNIMKAFGAKDEDFVIKISSRETLDQEAIKYNLSPEKKMELKSLLDKKGKMPQAEHQKKLDELVGGTYDWASLKPSANVIKAVETLKNTGITNVSFDGSIVRGFDYYTGIVFEINDTNPENRRALFGGGRYDNLTSLFGGDKVPAVGFGMGDVTMRDFLETHNLLPSEKAPADYYICVVSEAEAPFAMKIADQLRGKSLRVAVDFTYKKLGDQIKNADKRGIAEVIVIGEDEAKTGKYKIKNLKTGKERTN
jgi:histidyl-tRNA synthetase